MRSNAWDSFRLTEESCELLSRAAMHALEELDLSHNQLRAEGMSRLARAHWPALRTLRVGHNKLYAAGVDALLCGRWPQLRHLDVRNNQLRGPTVTSLMRGPWPVLHTLDVRYNCMGPFETMGVRLRSRHLCVLVEGNGDHRVEYSVGLRGQQERNRDLHEYLLHLKELSAEFEVIKAICISNGSIAARTAVL